LSCGGGVIYGPLRHADLEDPKADVLPAPDVSAGVEDLIKRELNGSKEPVPCARIATTIAGSYTAVAADWYGKGTFRKFLESVELAPLLVHWNSDGGCIYDPVRHAVAAKSVDGQQPDDWSSDRKTLAFVKQIHEVTSVPLLSQERYPILFEEMAADVNANSFDFTESGKRIRDRCRDAGRPVSRADVTSVLRGLLLRGHEFGEKHNAPKDLSRTFANHVRSLCLREQIMLDPRTDTAIRRWIE
jgi:hypothetical protein